MSEFLSKQEKYTICILFLINVLNYMDRYTVAGVLGDLKQAFQIGDDYCGLLQTAFTLSYTSFAPLFGYLGDKYSRRKILTASVLLWSGATFVSSFTSSYGWFFVFRTLVGIGEASYSSIAPTIIYDVTYKKIRKLALALFFTAIPIGSGLGIVVGSKAARIGKHWGWAFRITPVLGLIGALALFLIKDSVRGERECLEARQSVILRTQKTFLDNVISLCKNRSYLYSTLGFTTMTFVNGAIAWWGPIYMFYGFQLMPHNSDILLEEIALEFGAISVFTGIVGVPLGAYISRKLTQIIPAVDPIICGVGILLCNPFIISAIFAANRSIAITYVCVFLGEFFMSLTWAIVADILLSVVVPESRSTAEALQIAVSHFFGDAGSPYVVGVLSEEFKLLNIHDHPWPGDVIIKRVEQFNALKYAMLSTVFMQYVGCALFIANAFYITEDRRLVIHTLVSHSGEELPRTVDSALFT